MKILKSFLGIIGIVIGCMALAAIFIFIIDNPNEEINKKVKNAYKYLENSRPKDAIKPLTQAINHLKSQKEFNGSFDPDPFVEGINSLMGNKIFTLPQLYLIRGHAYQQVGAIYYDDALSDFNEALDIKSDLPAAYLGKSIIYRAQGHNNKAISNLTNYQNYSPNDPVGYYERGVNKDILGDRFGACSDWRKAIDLGSKEAMNLVRRWCN